MSKEMATAESRVVSGGAADDEAEGQAPIQRQESIQVEWQEAVRRLEHSMRLRELQATVQRLEERLADLERRWQSSGAESAGGPGAVEQLEGRMARLEASVQRALESAFPRVDALLAQLERRSPPVPSAPSSSSSFSSASRSSSSSNSSSFELFKWRSLGSPPCMLSPFSELPASDPPPSQSPAFDSPPSQSSASNSPPSQSPASDSPPSDSPPSPSPASDSPPSPSPASDSPPSPSPASDSPPSPSPASDSPPSQSPASDSPPSQSPASDSPPSQSPASAACAPLSSPEDSPQQAAQGEELMEAVRRWNLEEIRHLLLDTGTSANNANARGETPLTAANNAVVYRVFIHYIVNLMARGADVRARGDGAARHRAVRPQRAHRGAARGRGGGRGGAYRQRNPPPQPPSSPEGEGGAERGERDCIP